MLTRGVKGRRREIGVLRGMGARAGRICSLILGGGMFMAMTGIALGIMLVFSMSAFGQGWIAREFGQEIGLQLITLMQVYIELLVPLFGCLIGLIP